MFNKTSFFKNIKAFLMSSSVVMSGVAGYIYFVSYQNRKRYLHSLEDDSAKDMTRIGYEYYGINWGFKADSMIKEKIDTGDLLFLKYECGECLTFSCKNCTMVKCYAKETIQNDFEYDSVGIAFRDQNGLFIIFDHLGHIIKMSYAEFLSQPYFREVALRKIIFPKESKEISKTFFRLSKVFFDQLLSEQNKPNKLSEDPGKFLREYFFQTTLADKQMRDVHSSLADFDRANPPIIDPLIKLDSKIIIRSKPNPNLVA